MKLKSKLLPKLTIELVPATCWFSNVRTVFTKKIWDFLRDQVYAEAGDKCEICGGRGRRHPVEAHEVWDFNEELLVQRLERLAALCPACHQVKHIGFAQVRGREKEALRHLAKVNGWTFEQARGYELDQFDIWDERSRCEWDLDISVLEDRYGLVLAKNLKKSKIPTDPGILEALSKKRKPRKEHAVSSQALEVWKEKSGKPKEELDSTKVDLFD